MVMTGGRLRVAVGRVREHGPVLAPSARDHPLDGIVAGMEQHHERSAAYASAARTAIGDLIAVEDHAEGALTVVEPFGVAHLVTGRQEPGDVLSPGPVHGLA